jgi:hypothetical protein
LLLRVMCVTCLLCTCCTTATGLKPICSQIINIYIYIYIYSRQFTSAGLRTGVRSSISGRSPLVHYEVQGGSAAHSSSTPVCTSDVNAYESVPKLMCSDYEWVHSYLRYLRMCFWYDTRAYSQWKSHIHCIRISLRYSTFI